MAETVTAELPPLQRTGVAFAEAMSVDEPVIVIVVVAVQLLASVTVNE